MINIPVCISNVELAGAILLELLGIGLLIILVLKTLLFLSVFNRFYCNTTKVLKMHYDIPVKELIKPPADEVRSATVEPVS